MTNVRTFQLLLFLPFAFAVRADELLYSYEGEVLPYAPSAGWVIADPCTGSCSEMVTDEVFTLSWDQGSNVANYHFWISVPKTPSPLPPFWIEWRFASNQAIGQIPGCDGRFSIHYRMIHEPLDLFGDAVLSFDGGIVRRNLRLGEFQVHHFHTLDGSGYMFAVNGNAWLERVDAQTDNGYAYLQFGGHGPCSAGKFNLNEWDYVRYGRITYGEQIIASDPPGRLVDARAYAPLDRFAVTFDEPNYVMVDEIGVEVIDPLCGLLPWSPSAPVSNGGGGPLASARGTDEFDIRYPPFGIPTVAATGRMDNGPPDEVEIVLDQPIAFNATTRFTFNDGVAVNVVEFTFAPGDTDGDGDADLADFSYFQSCFGPTSPCPLTGPEGERCGPCLVLDQDADSVLTPADYAAFFHLLNSCSDSP